MVINTISNYMKIIRIVSRLFVGLVFVFSGFVKLVDPLGSAYKFADYFQAFHMGAMEPAALYLSIVMSLAEFLIGVSLLIGLRMRVAAWAVLIFMSFFTVLTLFLALYNPVTDCGCFGDAFVITNWQTFGKNIILMVFVIVIFWSRNKYKQMFDGVGEWFVVTGFALFGIWFTAHCYNHLPVIDFRPYKTGTNISEGMIIPDSQKNNVDQYKTSLFYKKNGMVKEFDIKNLPDSTWQWVETKSNLIKEGYHPPIHNFVISNAEGSEITDIMLSDTGYAFYLIAYNLEKASVEHVREINNIAGWCQANNIIFKGITSSSPKLIEHYKKSIGSNIEFYTADEITLKTMIRSNPGLMLIRNGTILAMWHHNDLPNVKELKTNLASYVTLKHSAQIEKQKIWNFILGFVILIMLTLLGKFLFIKSR